MYVVIYGIISDEKEDISIMGPYFGGCDKEKEEAEKIAREISNKKTKDVIIPWVMYTNKSLPDMMLESTNSWFNKFRKRTMDSINTLERDQNKLSCPFVDVQLETVLEKII